jgi:hypothetical protein
MKGGWKAAFFIARFPWGEGISRGGAEERKGAEGSPGRIMVNCVSGEW